jgi:hypothetical protein
MVSIMEPTGFKLEHTIEPSSLISPHEVFSASAHLPSPAPSDESSSPSPDDDEGQSPESSDSQPRKKRKSWGQVLPEPTTNLPPRKRAKTEAEKQQRKYERVQRNRQAAHNSRLRKQMQMEQLEQINADLVEKLQAQELEIQQLRAQVASTSKLATIPNIKVESDHDSSYDSENSPQSPIFNSFNMNIAQSADTHSAEMC